MEKRAAADAAAIAAAASSEVSLHSSPPIHSSTTVAATLLDSTAPSHSLEFLRKRTPSIRFHGVVTTALHVSRIESHALSLSGFRCCCCCCCRHISSAELLLWSWSGNPITGKVMLLTNARCTRVESRAQHSFGSYDSCVFAFHLRTAQVVRKDYWKRERESCDAAPFAEMKPTNLMKPNDEWRGEDYCVPLSTTVRVFQTTVFNESRVRASGATAKPEWHLWRTSNATRSLRLLYCRVQRRSSSESSGYQRSPSAHNRQTFPFTRIRALIALSLKDLKWRHRK